jgi:hypothetical protein
MSPQDQLHVIYKVEMVLGFIVSLFVTPFVAIMSMDSPSATTSAAVITGIVVFSVLNFLLVLVPLWAVEELNRYSTKKRLVFNIFNALCMLFFFFPVALWQMYQIKRVSEYKEEIKKVFDTHKKYETRTNTTRSALYIIGAIILFYVGSYYLNEYSIKDREIVLDCGRDYISTKGFFSQKLYFTNKTSHYLYKYNYSSLGKLDGDTIVVTNPYLGKEKMQKIKACVEKSGKYRLTVKTD